ncbi:MAG: hypothetical protein KAH38_07940, partial [Candidatus Hydrogenedentes bacterium]|nr:hypothetical protein [Candidatus Hydrogenedentota bacterium]
MRLIFRGVIFVVAAMLFSISASGEEATSFGAKQLRCEGRENPLGVEEQRPVLSWSCVSDLRSMEQSAFRLLVASDLSLLVPGQADIWDSEKVLSSEQRVSYGGSPLQAMDHIVWSVCIWDQEGSASDWSTPATWSMGLLRPEDWKADWITGSKAEAVFEKSSWIWVAGEDAMGAPVGTAWFIKSIEVRKDVAITSAKMYVAADNSCRIIINGEKQYRVTGWKQFSGVDIAPHFHPGSNHLQFQVVNDSSTPNPAGLLVEIDIRYVDGVVQKIASDRSWQAVRTDTSAAVAPGSEDVQWHDAQELGACDMEPWAVAESKQTSLPLFRKTFTLQDSPIRYAVVNICGLGHFELSLNGSKVGDHVFD